VLLGSGPVAELAALGFGRTKLRTCLRFAKLFEACLFGDCLTVADVTRFWLVGRVLFDEILDVCPC